VSYRFLSSICMMSLLLLSCAGSTQVHETDWPPHSATRAAASKPKPVAAPKTASTATSKSGAEAPRDAKTTAPETDEDWPRQDFAGVDTSAPTDDTGATTQEVAVKGIEGTTSEYDVRTALESRAQDFDSCHDRVGGGSGRIEYRIHILANGDVGAVKIRKLSVRNRKLVDCYTEVVSSSHFTQPHGGYADVKWTTKVGRSRKRPDALFVRKARWDASISGGKTHRAAADRRRGRRNGA
jgi:hypothetical protein